MFPFNGGLLSIMMSSYDRGQADCSQVIHSQYDKHLWRYAFDDGA